MLSCTMGDNYKLSYNNTCLIQFRCLQNNLKLTKYFSHPKSSITDMVWIHGGYFQEDRDRDTTKEYWLIREKLL